MRVFQAQIAMWKTELEQRRRDGWGHDNKVSRMVAAFKKQKQFEKLSRNKKQFVHENEDWYLDLQVEKQYFHERIVEAVERIRECEGYIDTLHRQKRVLAGDVRKHKARGPRRARRSYSPSAAC